MIELEENRVYDIGQIETLRTTGARLLDTGIASCITWDMAISELESLQSGTPVKCAELKGALGAVSGPLNKPEYDTGKYKVDGILSNAIARIPQQDIAGSDALEPLAENLQMIMGMTEDLTGCIGAAGTNLTLSEYQQKLEGIKQEWDDEILEDSIPAIETILLGVPDNIAYAPDNMERTIPYSLDYWLIQRKNNIQSISMESILKGSSAPSILTEYIDKMVLEAKIKDKNTDIVIEKEDKNLIQSECELNSLENMANNEVNETDSILGDTLIFPKPGETITISRGTDLEDETAVVFSRNAWSRDYSVDGCNSDFAGELCCERLNYAIENYESNSSDNDLLMFTLDEYEQPVFAGAMVEGYADIGDIVEVTLDDDSNFNFMILDVKSTKHTSQELASNNQCQCEWGHGYMLGEGTVQLSICEFITAGSCSESSVQNTESGTFLKNRSVTKAQIIDHIPICNE